MRTKCVRAAWSFALCLSVALTACDDENNENDGPVVPPPVDESIDLTASEAYANCFIVTEADEYRFATRKVDGSDVEGIVSVDWLWSTKNAAGNPLVSEVSYKDGIVHFTSDGTEGNTVLAAFDAKGEVIWSWHLWMTDQPELFAYDEGGELMDRNLGATSALEADGAASFGLLYQWGRKDPFYGGEKNEDSGDGVFLRARESTIVNPAHASLAWIAVQCDEQVGTVAYATAHPTTFLFNSPNGNKDWLFTGEDALWDNAGKKTNYDPCPAGYRVPDQAAWGNISSYNVDDGPNSDGKYYTTDSGAKTWFPLCGHRWGDKDAGKLGYVGAYGTMGWWQRTAEGSNAAMFYTMYGTYATAKYAFNRASASSVRCQKTN